ncbi:MAG: hypothetical protein JW841_14655 [Deltaproteobacteria bacterium]|nr:hypothetical protein [Deltaproteobacteria bacterium]
MVAIAGKCPAQLALECKLSIIDGKLQFVDEAEGASAIVDKQETLILDWLDKNNFSIVATFGAGLNLNDIKIDLSAQTAINTEKCEDCNDRIFNLAQKLLKQNRPDLAFQYTNQVINSKIQQNILPADGDEFKIYVQILYSLKTMNNSFSDAANPRQTVSLAQQIYESLHQLSNKNSNIYATIFYLKLKEVFNYDDLRTPLNILTNGAYVSLTGITEIFYHLSEASSDTRSNLKYDLTPNSPQHQLEEFQKLANKVIEFYTHIVNTDNGSDVFYVDALWKSKNDYLIEAADFQDAINKLYQKLKLKI